MKTISDLSIEDWIIFYKKQAGIVTDDEFERYVAVLDGKKLEQEMLAVANPMLIKSAVCYFCTDSRDREKSSELIKEAAAQGDEIAVYIMNNQDARWLKK